MTKPDPVDQVVKNQIEKERVKSLDLAVCGLEADVSALTRENKELKAPLSKDIDEWPSLWRIMCERMFVYSIQNYNMKQGEAAKSAQHICRKLYEERH